MRKLALVTMVFCVWGCDSKSPETAKASIETNEASGENWCEDAHSDLEKMMQGLRETVSVAERANIKTPPRESYITRCKALPENVQKCLVVSYAQKNIKACEKIETSLDPETAKTFQKLVSGE